MTAVEKFIEQLEEIGGAWENVSIKRIQISIKVENYLELQSQAKEMEKQQMNSNKCYHPLTERKHTSDTNFECTICGYNNY